jgi:hypothetical protein
MFKSEEIQILIKMLENNHLKLGEEDDVAYIGYVIRHLKGSLLLESITPGLYAIEPVLVKDQAFFGFLTRELEWLSENEQCNDDILNTCEKLFNTFMPNPDKFETNAINTNII